MEKIEIVSERQNIILMALYSFYERGKEEVSLAEFLECIKKIQENIPLKYEFSERFLYSPDLMKDLRDLEYRGFARRFTYRHDAFLPKSYITLTGFGKSHAKKIAQIFPSKYAPFLEKCTNEIIEAHRKKWRVFARSAR